MKIQVNISEEIAETMLGPLWARATFTPKYPDILNDLKAVELIENLEYDFSEVKKLDEWRALGLLARAKHFDDAANNYIESYPRATIISIGSGLDTTFYRVDNGNISWVDIDLPEIIKLRENLLPAPERVIYIAKSVFDYSWFNDVQVDINKGVFIIAGGFMYYFKENQVIDLLTTLKDRFPGGEIIFDAVSKIATRVVNKRAKKANSDLRFKFSVGKVRKFVLNHLPNIELVDSFVNGYNIPINPKWSKKSKKMIRFARILKTGKIVHLKF